MNPRDITGVGLYVHVPFCRQLCPYCDFAVAVRDVPPHDAYCDALLVELEGRREELSRPPATVYFGGGTPALWEPAALRRFLASIDLTSAVEVTIEANPLDITPGRLDAWHEVGIDRVSLGVQSFDDAALDGLGRDHDAATARRSVELVVADDRFRTSLDLIYGGPNHDEDVLERDLRVIAQLLPDHVSAYELTIEPDTVFGRRHRAGTLRVPDEERVIDVGFELVRRLDALGYERYEVSSFGRGGDRGLHNSGYWLGRDYLGLGVGAHGLRRVEQTAMRRANPRRLGQYLADPHTPDHEEHLDANEHLGERLLLASRTTIGVSWSQLREQFDGVERSVWDRVDSVASQLVSTGMLERGSDLGATARGLDFADWIAQRFWDATHKAPQFG